MTWQEALDLVVSSSGHARFRALCDSSHPDHETHRARVVELAIGTRTTPAVRGSPIERPSFPPLLNQLANVTTSAISAMAGIAAGEPLSVDASERDRRMAICERCDRLEPSSKRCLACGCKAAVKVWMTREKCPLGKWGSQADGR